MKHIRAADLLGAGVTVTPLGSSQRVFIIDTPAELLTDQVIDALCAIAANLERQERPRTTRLIVEL